jgi:hypothetical protein
MRDPSAAERLFDERLEQSTPDQLASWMLSSVVSRFETRLDQLRTVGTQHELHRNDAPESLVTARRGIQRQRRVRIETAAQAFVDALRDEAARIEAEVAIDDELGGEPTSVVQPEHIAVAAMMLIDESRVDQLVIPLGEAIESASDMELAEAYLGWKLMQETPAAFLDACLPAAVSEFEELLAALLRIGQMLYPSALGANRQQTTIEDIERQGGLDAAKAAGIDLRARTLVNEGVFEWPKRLRSWPGIDPTTLTASWDDFSEIFLRRNVVVHCGARTDAKYLELLPAACSRPLLGEPLHCDGDYVLRAIDKVRAVGSGLGALWLRKLRPNANHPLHRAETLVVKLLHAERWADVDRLATTFIDAQGEALDTLLVNRWMAQRELAGSVEVIAEEVAAWTPPDDRPRWSVARAALLDDERATVQALRTAAALGESVAEYGSWPLLRVMRRHHPVLGFELDRRLAIRRGTGR